MVNMKPTALATVPDGVCMVTEVREKYGGIENGISDMVYDQWMGGLDCDRFSITV